MNNDENCSKCVHNTHRGIEGGEGEREKERRREGVRDREKYNLMMGFVGLTFI